MRKPDETSERYGTPRAGVSVVVTKAEFNTYVRVERLIDGEWRYVEGSSRGMGNAPYTDLVESLCREHGILRYGNLGILRYGNLSPKAFVEHRTALATQALEWLLPPNTLLEAVTFEDKASIRNEYRTVLWEGWFDGNTWRERVAIDLAFMPDRTYR